MRFILALFSLLACCVQSVAFAAAPAPVWPREVQAVYDGIKADCHAEGGKFIADRANFATQTEITNDGKTDWVLEYNATRCTTSGYSEWCGTAGCIVSVLGSTPTGLREIYNGNLRAWKAVALDKKRKGFLTSVHGTACGGFGADICIETLLWDGRKWVTVSKQKNVDPWAGELDGDETDLAAPEQTARWQFAGSGANAFAAITGHPEFAAIGVRCQPGGGLYMTVVPKAGVALPASGHPLLLAFTGSVDEMEATQPLLQEPGKPDFSGTLAAPVEALLVGRNTEVSMLASIDGGDEWSELTYVPLGGSTAAMHSLAQQCASAAGAVSSAQGAGQKPVAPLGIVAGYYVREDEACSNPQFEALYYDGKRLGLMRGHGAPGSLEEDFVGALGKAEKSGGSFFLPDWGIEAKILSSTRIQLTIQDTELPRRWCPADQIPGKWRIR